MNASRMYRGAALAAIAALALTACSTDSTDDASGDNASATTITVEDNFGTQTVTLPAESIVATDNGTFETLDT